MANPTAREVVEQEIELLERRLESLRLALQAIIQGEQATVRGDGPSISPREFVGMDKADAVIKYLNLAGKTSASLTSEVLPALARGGADLGKDKERHARNLKIAVRMNSKPTNALTWDEKTDTVGLRETRRGRQTA